MRSIAVLLLALAAVAAGCVTPPDVDPAGTVAEFVDPIVEDHDHASFADHALQTESMHLIGWSPMAEDGKPFSYIGEMDTHGNLTAVQILGRGSMPGFVLMDVSDPANPTPVGRAEMPFSYVVDVKFSPDGKSVFAASQAGAQRSRAHSPPTDDPVFAALTGNGFTQFDVSDPANPTPVAGGLAEPFGCHMLSVKELGGTLTVFCVADTILVFQYTTEGAWMPVATLAPGDTAGADRVLGETQAAGANAPFAFLLGATPHDLTIQEDPLEPGRWIASVSYWDLGLRFFDVTDPTNPTLLGSWAGEGAEVYEGNVHGAMLTVLDGKRVAVAGPELLSDTYPALWVLDVSDYAAPTVLGEWVPPGAHATQGLLLTTHQFQLVDGRVYLAYNHAGVWVLDLATIVAGEYADDPARPEVLGYYLPHMEVELYDADLAAVPNTWDLNVKDGYVLASDRYTGFYVLHYAADTAGDPSLTSFA